MGDVVKFCVNRVFDIIGRQHVGGRDYDVQEMNIKLLERREQEFIAGNESCNERRRAVEAKLVVLAAVVTSNVVTTGVSIKRVLSEIP